METGAIEVNVDEPLKVGSAIGSDELQRSPFARTVAEAIVSAPLGSGLVVSIEGAWGSGKSSMLAMIEELLMKGQGTSPVIVHFNPWLIGEREALLRQLLAQLSTAIGQHDATADGKRVAKEIKAYSKAFDVLKLIPGAEPWASMVKMVMEAVGDTTKAVSEHKEPDLAARKEKLRTALAKYGRPIVVLIDDIDRLFPAEVFEILRIIKAAGQLPQVAYVVAWDPTYIAGALRSLSVHSPLEYLDKIVQVRLSLPIAPSTSLLELFNKSLTAFPREALAAHFPLAQERLEEVYFAGLRPLLQRPRDLKRVFNVARVLEALLRREVVLADILGLAAIQVKAPPVYALVCARPELFTGPDSSNHRRMSSEGQEVEDARLRNEAYAQATEPASTRRLVHFLFPYAAQADGGHPSESASAAHGCISDPRLLRVALQLGLSGSDPSAEQAKRFLENDAERDIVAQGLTEHNCIEFLSLLEEIAEARQDSMHLDPLRLSLAVGRLIDTRPFCQRARRALSISGIGPESLAERLVIFLIDAYAESDKKTIVARVVATPDCLSLAARLLVSAARVSAEADRLHPRELELLVDSFADNAVLTANTGMMTAVTGLRAVLHALARFAPQRCPEVFEAIRKSKESVDDFIVWVTAYSVDSKKGLAFSYPDMQGFTEPFTARHELEGVALSRLADNSLTFPARAAWKSVIEEKAVYALDGTDA